MSEYENAHDDTPAFEPWLVVLLSSIVPEIVATRLPPQFFVPAIVATVTLFVAGLVMLRRQTVQRRRLAESRTTPGKRQVARVFEGRALEAEGVGS